MNINLILIPFVIILGLVLAANDNQRNRRLYIILCNAVLIIVASMRSPEWLTKTYRLDSLVYKVYFETFCDLSWDEIFSSAHTQYFVNNDGGDIGFQAMNKLVGYFTSDFQFFSLIVDLLFFVPYGILLYKYSTNIKQIMFAFVFYIALIQILLLSGGRQNFAIGFDMLALLSIINRKRFLTVLFFLIGVTIHFSSFLFLGPLLMIWYGFKPKTLKVIHIVCFLLFPLVWAMPNELIVFMGDIIGVEKYSEYGKGSIQRGSEIFIIIIELLSLFCLMAIKKDHLLRSANMLCIYIMAPFFTFFAPLIYSNGAMIRISLYYHLFLVILVPYAIECAFKKDDKKFAYYSLIGVLALYAMYTGVTYYFFWQI